MKILIAADMEGVTGVTHWNHVTSTHAEYNRFRHLMTGDVNAAVAGSLSGGAQTVIVTDGHGDGSNLLIEELDPVVRLNTGDPSPVSMLQGIGPDVDGVIFVGYHARAGTTGGILDHTWSSSISGVWLNGTEMGEVGLNAAVCGHFGVPVIAVCGCQAACTEAVELLGELEVAPVKTASSRTAAECLTPATAQSVIESACRRALEQLGAASVPPPFRVRLPVELCVAFTHSGLADGAARLPGTRRDGCRVICQTDDMLAAYRSFQVLASLAA